MDGARGDVLEPEVAKHEETLAEITRASDAALPSAHSPGSQT
jgi:hypothetical protein